MKKFFTLFAAMLTALTMSAETATWSFEENADGLAVVNSGSAATDRGAYSSIGSSIANASGDYCMYANLGATKGSASTVTTTASYAGIQQISMLLGSSDRGKTEIALLVCPNEDFASEVETIVAQATVSTAVPAITKNNNMVSATFTLENEASGYVRIVLAQASGSNNKKMFVDDLTITYTNEAPSQDPVTTAEINGANACIVGNSVELVCTAPKATEYKWSLNGTTIEGANTKKYTFTPTAEGNYSFTCLAANSFNLTPVISEPFVVAVVDPAKATGEIIKATLKGGPNAEVTGIVGGTFDSNLKSGKYKIDKGYYAGIILAKGTFQAGDTVIITMSAAGGNYPCLFGDKDRNNLLFLATEGSEALEYRIVLTESANGVNSLYISRDAEEADGYKWNPTLTSIAVVRPMPETSRVEELTGAKIADYTLTESNLSVLKNNKYIKIGEDYVAAPVVVFTKTITITYEDNSTKEVTEDIKVTATADGNLWKAYATIAGEEYTIAANKAASFTVTYMYGKNVLGTEMVAVGAEPKEYEQYQTMTLATFEGWYRDEDLTTPVSLPMAITQDFTFYAKFNMAYLNKNVNIEQLVLDNGTKYDIQSALTAAGWAYENLNDLDTLNDLEKKDNRNEAFLGLKMKTKGAYIQGNLKVDGVLIVKFGNIGCDINVTIKGAESNVNVTFKKEDLWSEDDQAYVLAVYGFPDDVLVTITTTDGSTVVLKQLMLDELAEVTLPAPGAYLVTCEANENGKVEAAWPNKKYRTPVGETVTITATPNEGYALASITVNGTAIEAVEGVYSFEMPAEEVTVAAVFTSTVALENIKAEGKAVKVVINGQLYIKKGDKLFNALGTMLK